MKTECNDEVEGCIFFVEMLDEIIETQEASCDGQTLSLECPIGTKIAIHFVQYGRAAPSSQVRMERVHWEVMFPPQTPT